LAKEEYFEMKKILMTMFFAIIIVMSNISNGAEKTYLCHDALDEGSRASIQIHNSMDDASLVHTHKRLAIGDREKAVFEKNLYECTELKNLTKSIYLHSKAYECEQKNITKIYHNENGPAEWVTITVPKVNGHYITEKNK
jgi:hypothetical protein